MDNIIQLPNNVDVDIAERIKQLKAYLKLVGEKYKNTKLTVFLYDRSGMVKQVEVPWLGRQLEIRIPTYVEAAICAPDYCATAQIPVTMTEYRTFRYYKTVQKYEVYREIC